MSDDPTLRFPVPAEPELEPAQRRRWWAAAISALATLVVLLPIAVLLLLRHGGAPIGSPAPASQPASSAPATSPAPGTSPATAAPDGRISLATLGNATLDLPPWPADDVQGPAGRVRFRNGISPVPAEPPAEPGQPPQGSQVLIIAVTYGDVDSDGAAETVAEIGCLIEGGSKQLIAFDRDAAGAIVTLGAVVKTTGEVRDIGDGSARVDGHGTVSVRLADFQRCCDDQTPQIWQTRAYRWQGGAFRQVGGPAAMTVNPYVTETSVTAGDLDLGPVVDGYRYGTVAVHVTYRWGARPAAVTVRFYPADGLERAGSDWGTVQTTPVSFAVTRDWPVPQSLLFAFRRPAVLTGGRLEIEVAVQSAPGAPLSEAIAFDDAAVAQIRTVNLN